MGIQGIRSHECEVCAKQILELPGACAHGTYCAREIFAHAQSLVKSHFLRQNFRLTANYKCSFCPTVHGYFITESYGKKSK